MSIGYREEDLKVKSKWGKEPHLRTAAEYEQMEKDSPVKGHFDGKPPRESGSPVWSTSLFFSVRFETEKFVSTFWKKAGGVEQSAYYQKALQRGGDNLFSCEMIRCLKTLTLLHCELVDEEDEPKRVLINLAMGEIAYKEMRLAVLATFHEGDGLSLLSPEEMRCTYAFLGAAARAMLEVAYLHMSQEDFARHCDGIPLGTSLQ